MAFWNRKKKTQPPKGPGIQPDTPPRKAGWVQRREETKEEERLKAESATTGIAMGPIEGSELAHQQKMEKEALSQVGQTKTEGKTSTVEETARRDLLSRQLQEMKAEAHPKLGLEEEQEGAAQAPETEQTASPEGQQATTPETKKPTLSERRAAAIDPTRLRESIKGFEKEVEGSAHTAAEGKVKVPAGAGDSESKG